MAIAAAVSPAGAGEAATILFQLRCPQPQLVADKKPRCLRLLSAPERYEVVATAAAFGANGICALSLEPGTYRFEILEANQTENQIVAIRSGPVEVNATTTSVSLPSASQTLLRFAIDGSQLSLRQVAIRSVGDAGEARWIPKGTPPGTGPAIFTSHNQPLQVCLVGTADRVTSVIWKRINPAPTVDVRLNSGDYRVCDFALDPATPTILAGEGTMTFPDCTVKFPLQRGHRFIVNRSDALFGYELNASNGRKLVVVPTPTALAKRTTLAIGGQLRAKPWAAPIWKDDGKHYAQYDGGLVDAAGREVHLHDSKLGYTTSVRLPDQDPIPDGAVLDETGIKAFQKPASALVCEVAWTWERPQQFRGPPEEMIELKSAHFSLRTPPVWKLKAENYLAQLERTHGSWKMVSGHGGPRMIDIGWRYNTHNAKARIGGEVSWMSMPFHGLRMAAYPFNYPWFMVHEMGHTFGYNHGKPMDDAVDAVDRENDRQRWMQIDAFTE